MPEFVNTFNAGKMNKDLDERLIPPGQYRDALNIDVANSEGGDMGALQNIKGNVQLRNKIGRDQVWASDYIDALCNPKCIGSFPDPENERVYWFIASDKCTAFPKGVSAIAEYDQIQNVISPVLVDTEDILKFSEEYLITGINKIDKFLFWTDDQTEPKKINIEKFKVGSVDFVTHTKIPEYDPISDSYFANINAQPAFLEEDVTTIKKSPTSAPTLDFSSSAFGDDVPGTGITPVATTGPAAAAFSNFTYVPNLDDEFTRVPLDTFAEYEVNIGIDPDFYSDTGIAGWNGLVVFNVSQVPQWAEGNIIICKSEFQSEFFVNFDWGLTLKVVSVNGTTITAQIEAISSDILSFNDLDDNLTIYDWECLLQEEDPMFEFKFPRFAYRWKYIDNEYSTFSPFTKVAFEGDKFEYKSSNGYNYGMTNTIRRLVINDLEWNNQEVQEIDVLYKESNSTAVYVVDTIDVSNAQSSPESYEIKSELTGAVVESNQILRPWDNVPLMAKAQEVIGNRIVYGNYLQNRDVPSTEINLSYNPSLHSAFAEVGFPVPSLKSIRTYQVGVVYIDKFGRETPVFTSDNGSITLGVEAASQATSLSVSPQNTPPDWATHYKFFIKETSNEYYNLALDKFYPAEDGNVWLSFPSSERNKVDEETFLILKKQHDTDVAVTNLSRYKILAIKNEAPVFISSFPTNVGAASTLLQGAVEPGFLVVTAKGPTAESNPTFGPNLAGNKVVFFSGAEKTDEYDVSYVETSNQSGNDITYEIVLTRPLGPDATFISQITVGGTLGIRVIGEKPKNAPEFDGRFFVKINRDFNFDTNIISSFAALDPIYGIRGFREPRGATSPSGTPFGVNQMYYGDVGNSYRRCDSQPRRDYEHRLGGWGIGVGSWIRFNQSVIDAFVNGPFQPPTRGSKHFGVLTTRFGEFGDYLDVMFGNSLPQGGVGTPNGFLTTGAQIRFIAKNQVSFGGEILVEAGGVSDVYTVDYALGMGSWRGGRTRGGSFCQGSTEHEGDPRNRRYAIYMRLDRPIREPWMPVAGDWGALENVLPSIQVVERTMPDGNKLLTSNNPAIFETEPKEAIDLDLYYEATNSIPISQFNNTSQPIDWFNCFSYGQGVESNRIRDDFNAVTIDKGPKVSTVLDEPYAAERRGSGFIYSGIFNSTSGINRLNQFIQAEKITKDLNPIHGTIQKLHARDTDLIALCEDKCFRVLANKDALFNADGNVNLTGNNSVLGQTVPYAGDYGISKNPESFAKFAFRSYFADKNRGSIIRLSRDGLTVISEKGMEDFFSDNLASSSVLIGSYDEDKGLYNITLNNLSSFWQSALSKNQSYNLTAECDITNSVPAEDLVKTATVSFKEKVDGWTSRKSFIPENGVSLNNNYYTLKEGLLWQHNFNETHNNFYSIQYNSTFNVVVGNAPQVVKGFSALNYTGTKSREIEYEYNGKWYSIAEINAGGFLPIASRIKTNGWHVNYVRTNLESGSLKEFEKKEGKYFNYIKALEVCKSGEGIGIPDVIDPDPQSYNLTFTIDPSCSDPGNTVRYEAAIFWYLWDRRKPQNDCVDPLNIKTISTAQDTKCAIDEFYSCDVSSDYVNILPMVSQVLSYSVSEGLNVGTQMYDVNTLDPAVAQTLLYTNEQNVDHGSLDPGNPTAVPDSYDIVIIGSDGKISSITQYNTLDPCVGDPEKRAFIWTAYSSVESPPATPTNFVITLYNPSFPPVSNAELICAHKNAFDEYFASALLPCVGGGVRPCKTASGIGSNPYYYSSSQGGSDSIAVGTQFYQYSQTLGRYSTAFPNGFVGIIDINDYNTRLPQIGMDGSGFVQNFWNDTSTIDDKYKIIRIDNNGVVTHLDQINQIPNPTCP